MPKSTLDLIEERCPFESTPAIVPYVRSAFSARHPATQNGASFFQKLLLILDLMGPPSHFDVGGMCRYRLLVGARCSLHVRAVVYDTRKVCRVSRTFSSPRERKLRAVSSLLLHRCAFRKLPETNFVLLHFARQNDFQNSADVFICVFRTNISRMWRQCGQKESKILYVPSYNNELNWII